MLENEALYVRKSGEEVTQQLYCFEDKGGRRVRTCYEYGDYSHACYFCILPSFVLLQKNIFFVSVFFRVEP